MYLATYSTKHKFFTLECTFGLAVLLTDIKGPNHLYFRTQMSSRNIALRHWIFGVGSELHLSPVLH